MLDVKINDIEESMEHGEHMELVGLDKHLSKQSDKKIDDSNEKSENIISDKNDKVLSLLLMRHKRHSSIQGSSSKSIYRLCHSDTWACHNCKVRDDRIGMENHHCSMSKKGK